jgi:hypothetical protein
MRRHGLATASAATSTHAKSSSGDCGMGVIEAIENSAYAEFVRSSPSFFAYTFILSLHAMGLALIVGLNSVVALRMLGFVPELSLAALRKLFPWMYFGFTINAFSGLSLMAANMAVFRNPMFDAKLLFVALGMINLELTRSRIFDNPAGIDSADVAGRARKFAAFAFVFWGLALVSGRLTAYPGFVNGLFGIA